MYRLCFRMPIMIVRLSHYGFNCQICGKVAANRQVLAWSQRRQRPSNWEIVNHGYSALLLPSPTAQSGSLAIEQELRTFVLSRKRRRLWLGDERKTVKRRDVMECEQCSQPEFLRLVSHIDIAADLPYLRQRLRTDPRNIDLEGPGSFRNEFKLSSIVLLLPETSQKRWNARLRPRGEECSPLGIRTE